MSLTKNSKTDCRHSDTDERRSLEIRWSTVIPNEFTSRKVRRKLDADGYLETVRAAGDLLTRKRVGRRIFDPLVEHEYVQTLSRPRLKRRAVTMEVHDEPSPIPFVSVVDGGHVLTKTGLSLTADFEIIEESAAEPKQAQQAMMAMLSRQLFYGDFPIRGILSGSRDFQDKSSAPLAGPVAPLIPRYPNYYHWMVETVPKIRYLRQFQSECEAVTLLIPADSPTFVQETLERLSWPESQIMRAERGSYVVSKLVVPSYPDRRPTDFEWLREEILEGAPDRVSGSSTNVYVSRANDIERRVVNEDEVLSVLSEFGFKRYRLEERSLVENAQLFADADVIVGPHGAGLTDIVFAGDGTLIELFGEKVKKPYRLLADTVGVDYEAMYCSPNSTDILVDTEELSKRIKDAFRND